MNIEALFKHKAFSRLESNQMHLIRQFAKDVQGKGAAEIAKLYVQLNQQVSKIKPITPEQRDAIIDAILSFLPDSDKQKLNSFIKMFLR